MSEKNILYFTRTMGLGGTENVILQLCESMKDDFNKIIVCSCGGVNVSKLDELGIKHYNIPDIEKKSIKTIVNVLKTLYRIIKMENINVIHTHHRMAAFYVRIINLFSNYIFINTMHNTFEDKKLLTRFLLKEANNISVGDSVKNNLVDFYKIPESKISVIYNAIKPFNEIEFIEISMIKEYREKGYFTIGNIGRISEQKGMEYFVNSAKLVLKNYSRVKFFIIGAGEDEDKLRKLVNDLKIENDVIFLGYRSDVQNIMKQLDIVVLSSLWEGFPLTPIEAFSVKKTIIATDIEGTNEIVINNFNGITVPPRSETDMAKAIIKIMDNYKVRCELELNAYSTYIEKFSYTNFQEKYRKYYNDLIKFS